MPPPLGFSGGILANEIAQRVLKKYVAPLRATGGRIPTNRALAAEYDVNIGTITKALSFLAASGLIRPVVGSGTYVLPAEARKSQFGIYYALTFMNDRPENRINPILLREFHGRAAQADVLVREYADSNPHLGPEIILPPVLLEDVREGALDALFVAGALADDRDAFFALNIPTIGLGQSLSKGGVFPDRRGFAIQAVAELARRGARRLAFVSGGPFQEKHMDLFFGDRDGFLKALEEQGLPFESKWSTEGPPFQTDHDEYGKAIFAQLWNADSEVKPDGIVVGTDVIALGVLQGAREMGVRVPGDVLVAVAENRENIWPELSECVRFQFSMRELVDNAFNLLQAGPEASAATILVAARLVA